MRCERCGAELKYNQTECYECKTRINKKNKYCLNCGKASEGDTDVCSYCGEVIGNEFNVGNPELNGTIGKIDSMGGHDRFIMAFVCIFFGIFGVHNFMMGEIKKGILKPFWTAMFGMGIILVIIDFVKILTDKYIIDTDAYM